MMLLIVNADDLGTSEKVNDEVFELMASGLVTSASLIANAPAFGHAVSKIRSFPNCSFGVHLNLTVFHPLSSSAGLDAVLNRDGSLSKKLFQTGISSDLHKAFTRELSAQVQRVLDAGIPVSHFDSHQHIHTIPRMFPVLKTLQRRFGVRKVRCTITLLPASERMTRLRSLRKRLFRFALRHIYTTKSPDGLGDFLDFYALLGTAQIPQFRCLELMVHPGTTNPRYEEEVDFLRSDWVRRLPKEVRRGSYHSL